MSVVHLQTACVEGSRILPVTVEVDLHPGLPQFSIIGLPDKRIEEAKERVRAALKNSGFGFPLGRITVNLAPSAVRKQGTSFDLAIALGILLVEERVRVPEDTWFIGELSLSGSVQPCQQLIPILIEADRKRVNCVIPASQKLISGLVAAPVLAVGSLKELVAHLEAGILFSEQSYQSPSPVPPPNYLLDSLVGHAQVKRILTVSLAGHHNLMLTGPPGSGKSMLARAGAELLPPLSRSEQLVLAQLYAFAGLAFSPVSLKAPFRSPSPGVSKTGLLGGGTPLVPGEVSLAHAGLLFLDEFPEMSRPVRDSLRVPLQEKMVTHVRQGAVYQFPARAIVIAAQNSCPCGLAGVSGETCRCTAGELQRYQSALSEPLLDRFDLFCWMPKLTTREWSDQAPTQTAQTIKSQVEEARLAPSPPVEAEAKALLYRAVDQFALSGRALYSLERVSQTIAKLAGAQKVAVEHVQEALQYRRRPL